MIPDVTGKKEFPAKTIFAHGIKFLKDHLMKHMEMRGLAEAIPDDSYIQWVLTVPAIWNDSAKQFMREAAKEVGYPIY